MECELCHMPILATIRKRAICPQCYHRTRGVPPTLKTANQSKIEIHLTLPAELYEQLEPLAIQLQISVPQLIRQQLATAVAVSADLAA
jgi:Ribbon-helix-helix protein, copG family